MTFTTVGGLNYPRTARAMLKKVGDDWVVVEPHHRDELREANDSEILSLRLAIRSGQRGSLGIGRQCGVYRELHADVRYAAFSVTATLRVSRLRRGLSGNPRCP